MSKIVEFRQALRERVTREALLLVIGFIEATSEELIDSMIYADSPDETLQLQGQVRGMKDVVRSLRDVHERSAGSPQ